VLLRRDATYVTSAILPIRNVDLTSLPIARILLILKAELFLADHNTCPAWDPTPTSPSNKNVVTDLL